MIELVFALQLAGLPASVSETDFASLQQCFAENPPAAGDNRCAPVDGGVERIDQCLHRADSWEDANNCIEAPLDECWDQLHSVGTPTNLSLRYCGVRQIAYLEVFHAEQWERARNELSEADFSQMREVAVAMDAEAGRQASVDDYELGWLTIPTSRLRVQILTLEMAIRISRNQSRTSPL